MRDLLGWNIPLGRWGGVQIRLHAFFLLLLVFGFDWWLRGASDQQDSAAWGLTYFSVLLVSVVLHEFGHFLVARRLGRCADQAILWPFGGLTSANQFHDPRHEMATAVGGPLINLVICFVLAPILVVFGQRDMMSFNPLVPPAAIGPVSTIAVLAIFFWMNMMLFVINLLPALPLDGGRFLQAALWQRMGMRTAVIRISGVARVTGVALCIAGWYFSDQYPYAWLPLALAGVFVFFAARHDAGKPSDADPEDASFGYDFSEGYTSLERNYDATTRHPGRIRRWLIRRREERLERQLRTEEEEDRRVDAILVQLHESGDDSLSPGDRALLVRVSVRLRNRERG